MNDFTKEELDYIYHSILHNELEHHLEEDLPQYATIMLEKIQSMIDNYCEHQPEPYPEICCVKCQRTLL